MTCKQEDSAAKQNRAEKDQIMKPPTLVGICLIVFGVALGAMHFTTGKVPLGAAVGVLIGGVAVLFATKADGKGES